MPSTPNFLPISLQELSRRALFQQAGGGLGAWSLLSLLNENRAEEETGKGPAKYSMEAKPGHFPGKAKNIIFMHMVGGPSHLDLFDYKPTLVKHNGQDVPQKLVEGQRFAFIRGTPKLLGTQFKFEKHGQSGLELSEVWQHLPEVADDLAIVKTLHSELINHGPAQLFMQTGFGRFGRPGVGAWVTYGLGSENKNLPGFVVLITGKVAGAGSALWGSAFRPTVYQGIEFRNSGDPVLFLSNPKGMKQSQRQDIVDDVNKLNEIQLADVGDPEIATRISQYEMACRMQLSVPELTDLTTEPKHILEMYGAEPGKPSFANHCLLARRLVQRGVRMVQLYDADWDHHGSVFTNLPKKTKDVDRPLTALIKDLKAQGLLDETLVVWTAEFGRTPMLQGSDGEGNQRSAGRDHHKDAFCALLAGGGVKGGTVYGETDELGYYPISDPMHVNDFHATLLHLLGMDHKRLTFKFQGRNYRLTDVAGEVAHKLIS